MVDRSVVEQKEGVEVDLLSVDEVATEQVVSHGGSKWRRIVIGAVVALLVLWFVVSLAFALVGGDNSDDDVGSGPGDGAAQDRDDPEAAGQRSAEQDSAEQDSAEQDSVEQDSEEAGGPAQATTTEARPAGSANGEQGWSVVEQGEPIDPASPLALIIGSRGKAHRVTLATGTMEERTFESRDRAVIATDHYLVLQPNDARFVVGSQQPLEELTVVSLVDPSAPDATISSANMFGIPVVPADQADQVWVVGAGGGGDGEPATFRRIELGTGRVVEERPIPGHPIRTMFALNLSGSVDLLAGSAGGIYQFDGGGYRLAFPGGLLVAGSELVLVERCDERLTCVDEWRSRRTWEPVDRRVPPIGLGLFGARLFADRWLLYHDGSFGGAIELFDIETGQSIALDDGVFHGQAALAVSPDGRWMADVGGRSGGSVMVMNLETMETTELDVPGISDSVFFLDSPAG